VQVVRRATRGVTSSPAFRPTRRRRTVTITTTEYGRSPSAVPRGPKTLDSPFSATDSRRQVIAVFFTYIGLHRAAYVSFRAHVKTASRIVSYIVRSFREREGAFPSIFPGIHTLADFHSVLFYMVKIYGSYGV